MKKIVILSVFLFWFCLMFPSSSYIGSKYENANSSGAYSVLINGKELRFKLLDFLK